MDDIDGKRSSRRGENGGSGEDTGERRGEKLVSPKRSTAKTKKKKGNAHT